MRFYLDENESHRVAARAREFGLDVTCSHERQQDGRTDDLQLAYAAGEGRAMVTRNYSDFDSFTTQFREQARPHAGVLFLPKSLPSDDFDGIARSLALYARAHPDGMPPYMIDWLQPPGDWQPEVGSDSTDKTRI
jgi:hypothetical protein